jgi:sugar O-acyltransferase (sialic acid O-acetyltransferase NeuD family)
MEIADLASEIPDIVIDGFVENLDPNLRGQTLQGLPVFWVAELGAMKESHCVVGGLATTHRKRFADQATAQGMKFATLIHPLARISRKARIGHGVVVSAGSIVSAHTEIGAHVFVNRGVLIGHHTCIGEFSTLQPGANIAGGCRIAEQTYIGMGAIVVDNITIGAHSFISAGSVVTKNVADRLQVFGNPARVIRQNYEGK